MFSKTMVFWGTQATKPSDLSDCGWVSRVHHMREINSLAYSPYTKTRFYEHSVCHWFLKLRQLSSTLMMPIFVNDNLITLLWTMKTAQFNWYHEQRTITNTAFCFLAFFNALQPTLNHTRLHIQIFQRKHTRMQRVSLNAVNCTPTWSKRDWNAVVFH